ncbi:PREDICTED: trefoil factor 2 [Corvus brachyrhynchos]|nr:PREDICTED: trefoil factor 2 [Corvus brachyrhynchos]
MDLKVVCALSITLVIALSTLAEGIAPPTKCQCKVVARERTNCGYPGISAAECKKIGCCFNASVPSVPWCYSPKPKKVKKMCPNNPYTRINCGHPGIKPWECTKKGCCFRAHPAGVPWCFYHRVMEEGNVLQEMSPVSLWMLLLVKGETSIENFTIFGSTPMEQQTELPTQTLYFATVMISRLFFIWD